ncbi:NUDIX domain-containing protein [Streptomyces longispororuber]|uniref:NUDIX domain-containing protein n=1 Tax=Streptomyces longispororuber TaxID=68230 RepID=UPI003700FDBB
MPSAPPTTPARPSTTQRGTSRAIYAVTGVVDEVNDLIMPGAFARTLASRPVKSVWHHGWKDPVGVVLECEEWLPGDPRFAEIPDLGDWPAEAGALVGTVLYNLRTRQGRDAYEQVKQWHEHKQAAFSIGYRVPQSGASLRGDGVRVIHHLDLFEVSPVLHGAHPLTRALEVKSAAEHNTLEYKATPSHVQIDVLAKTPDAVKVAGLAVKAADTGRVLMLQRALDPDDPAAGTWEFPGGHLEDGEDALAAALREWQEETGSTLPGTASVVGTWTAPNGIYRGYVAVVPSEASLPINVPHGDRRVTNPDDPKGEATEVTAWWPIPALPDLPLLRPECRETPWALLAGAALPQGPPSAPPRAGAAARLPAGSTGAARLGAAEEKSARAMVTAARARGRRRIEHKSARAVVTEAKSRLTAPMEASVMSPGPLPESQEQIRARLADKVRELLDQSGSSWTCVEGTYPDRVIVSVHSPDTGGSTYAVPYAVSAAGEITLDKPQPVELATIVVPDGSSSHRDATQDEDVDARVVQPTVGALADATARVTSSTAQPEQLERVREKLRALIDALSSKGLDIAHDGPAPGARPGLDLWDEDDVDNLQNLDDDPDEEYAAPDEDDEDVAPAAPEPEETVRLDPDEVKAALALMQS